MTEEVTKIPNLAIGGYRSFGEIQYFDSFSKINLFIGRNNSGKSNVLRFLKEIYTEIGKRKPSLSKIDPLLRHIPDMPPLVVGIGEAIPSDESEETLARFFPSMKAHSSSHYKSKLNTIKQIFEKKAQLDNTRLCWSIVELSQVNDYKLDSWRGAMLTINNADLEKLWILTACSNSSEGNRNILINGLAKKLSTTINAVDVHLIPAIRQIGKQGSLFESEYDGTGIIDRLARLQNPDVHSQADRKKFEEITAFVRSVLDRNDAKIEIPYARDTILLYMDNKVLPLDSLGTGVHEVVILAAAATILSDTVLCIEEPELHLNPILQRKLMRYLSERTSNQYFITTHSPSIMDTVGAEVYHIVYEKGASRVYRASSDDDKSSVCEDLGYHPSDLLQANCVIWVEGPSDRIYLNYWLHHHDSNLIEGIHYSIMFYGGRLLSHLSYSDFESESWIDNFISLRRLNRRGIVLIDSDRTSEQAEIKKTKQRICEEFEQDGYAWVTNGREIENYIPKEQLAEAIQIIHPKSEPSTSFGKHDNCLKMKARNTGGLGNTDKNSQVDDRNITKVSTRNYKLKQPSVEHNKESQADKVKVAKYVTENYPTPDFQQLDLEERISAVIKYIEESNPAASIT